MKNIFKLNLHLFDGEGDGGATGETTTAAAVQTTGDNVATEVTDTTSVDAAQTTESEPVKDKATLFKELIEGEYKDQYDKSVQKVVRGRLKGAKENESKLASYQPLLQKMGAKYGKDPADVAGIVEAFDSDNSYWEERAMNEGLTVEQVKHIATLEAKEAQHQRELAEQQQEQGVNEIRAKWDAQAEQTKAIYPDFDLESEAENSEDFVQLLQAGVDVKTAYEVVHKDDIIAGAMQHTAEQVKQAVVNNVQARNSRPSENGSSSQASASAHIDPSKLSLAEMEALEKRAARGERITFR